MASGLLQSSGNDLRLHLGMIEAHAEDAEVRARWRANHPVWFIVFHALAGQLSILDLVEVPWLAVWFKRP